MNILCRVGTKPHGYAPHNELPRRGSDDSCAALGKGCRLGTPPIGELMFTNQSSGEVNFRVVFYGPSYVGKTATLQHLYDHTPADQKGKMISAETKTGKTIFYDLQLPAFGELNGKRVRVHVYALHGEVNY